MEASIFDERVRLIGSRMIINLKLLALYRKYLPAETQGSACQIEIGQGSVVRHVLESYSIPVDESSVILINGHAATPEDILAEGDVLCAFPSMAGG